jgi:hypothetical protein
MHAGSVQWSMKRLTVFSLGSLGKVTFFVGSGWLTPRPEAAIQSSLALAMLPCTRLPTALSNFGVSDASYIFMRILVW